MPLLASASEMLVQWILEAPQKKEMFYLNIIELCELKEMQWSYKDL